MYPASLCWHGVLCCPAVLAWVCVLQKDIILHDNDADLVLLNPDWEPLLAALKAALPGFRVFFVVPSEDSSIKWIRVMSGVGIMDLVRAGLRRPVWGCGSGLCPSYRGEEAV